MSYIMAYWLGIGKILLLYILHYKAVYKCINYCRAWFYIEYNLSDQLLYYSYSKYLWIIFQKPGSEIAVYGTVKCESDLPKHCFATTFESGQSNRVDYFTCKDCSFNCKLNQMVKVAMYSAT